ncbi:putative N-acetyltransferase camello isoform X1 [Pelodiscus sinensis]|uniref:putative N-acetyltransferase camello isoform X1 n=2 Tax=Pelodiscus sinensis TaxID=13735 RepID=UPI003F6C9000
MLRPFGIRAPSLHTWAPPLTRAPPLGGSRALALPAAYWLEGGGGVSKEPRLGTASRGAPEVARPSERVGSGRHQCPSSEQGLFAEGAHFSCHENISALLPLETCPRIARNRSAPVPGAMGDYRIRAYRDEDYEAAREVFANGMSEHVPALCVHVLKQPWVLLVLACTFCLLLTSSKSLLLPILALTLLLATGRQLLGRAWAMYIEHCLQGDLLDIRATYLGSRGSCFWVAEADECVVGTVAARPAGAQQGELMLKRLAVRKDYRRQGVATALCQAVLGFARQQGCSAVVLNSLMVQDEARAMYERAGFEKYREDVLPTLYGRLANVTVSKYRYSLARRS